MRRLNIRDICVANQSKNDGARCPRVFIKKIFHLRMEVLPMERLSYCLECRRVFNSHTECTYCNSSNIKELERKAPVNVIGTKLKGRVLKAKEGIVHLLFEGEKRVKSIKEFEISKIRKVL